MRKILGVGNALVDVIVPLPDASVLRHFSLAPGSMQLVDRSFSDEILRHTESLKRTYVSGGSAANAVSGAARMGVTTGFIGKVGRDTLGELYRNDLTAEGVQPILLNGEIPTGRCVALVTPDSERTFATWLGSAVTLSPGELTPRMFHGWDIVHVEGFLVQDHELLTRVARLAKDAGARLSLDLASYNVVEENLSFLHSIVERYVDIVFANEEEALAATGLPAEKAVSHIGQLADIAVVKRGPHGSLVATDGEVLSVQAIDAERIDTTGAGDLYAAGFLFELSRGSEPLRMAQTGTILATHVISLYGARIPREKWDTIAHEVNQ